MAIPIETLASYVPALITRHFSDDPVPELVPAVERFSAAALFADIVGFTPLAERLAQHGSEGAEMLTRMLNAYFGQLIDLVTGAGGDIVKFSGDGLLAIWRADAGDALAVVAQRAAQCGLDVQRQLDNYPVAADVNLSLHVGIGAGNVSAVHVGGIYDRWELVVSGETLRQVSLAEQQATAGQVVISREVAALLGGLASGEILPGGDVRLHQLQHPLSPKSAAPVDLSEAMSAALAAFTPAALRTRLTTMQGDWVAELRRLSIVFINLPDLGQSTTLDQAQTIMVAAQRDIYRFEGSILQLGVDDKGASLIAVFGLPPLAHEDDPPRAVRAALAVHATLNGLQVRNAIGVTTGRAFCGPIGNERRRTYTIVGDVINLAARLMQSAPGAILCDATTYQFARVQLAFDTLPAIGVKGKAEPVAVYRPIGNLERLEPVSMHRAETAIVGRSSERAALDDKLAALQRGESSVVVIEGEAGIGKSRLVEELHQQAMEHHVRALFGAGDAIEQSTPYQAWRTMFERLFYMDASAAADVSLPNKVLSILQPHTDWARLAPLLNAVLPLELPDNELTAQMAGQVRADNLQSLLTGILQGAATAQPLLLIVEDAHWLDSASWALIRLVVRDVHPLMLVIATRPFGFSSPPEYRQLMGQLDTLHLVLGVLPADDVLQLVCQRLGVPAIPPQVASFIQAKAEGHPFFSEELAYAMRDAGLIQIIDGECRIAPGVDLHAVTFPDTIQGVITSRIDRLVPSEQLALKVASVIGRIFAYRTLSDIYPLAADKTYLRDYLSKLHRLDLTPLDTPEPNLAYMFKHVITQEVAYNLMLFGQRRDLHRSVAEWYERVYQDDLAPHSPVLAYHWDKAGQEDKVIRYSEIAGEQMLQNGIYREAVTYFSHVLERSAHGHVVDAPDIVISRGHRISAAQLQRAGWERKLGQAYIGLGELNPAKEHFQKAAALLGWPLPTDLNRSLVRQLVRQLRLRVGVGAQQYRSPQVKAALLEAAHVYEGLGEIYYFANESNPLIDAWLRTLNLAERAESAPELARAYANVSLAAGLVPIHRVAQSYGKLAMQSAERSGQVAVQNWVGLLSGAYRGGIGDWEGALDAVQKVSEAAFRIGDWRRWQETQSLVFTVNFCRGEYARGVQVARAVYDFAMQHGHLQGQAFGLWGQGMNLLRMGRTEEAQPIIEQAIKIYLQTTDRPGLWIEYGLAAVAALREGNREAALSYAERVLSETKAAQPTTLGAVEAYAAPAEVYLALWESDGEAERERWRVLARQACTTLNRFARVFPIGQPRAALWQGLFYWLDNKPAHARVSWRKALSLAERLGMPYEHGAAHFALGRHSTGAVRREHLQCAREIFERIGAAYDLQQVSALLVPTTEKQERSS